MQIKEFLNTVCEQIKYKPIRNSISEELKNQIQNDSILRYKNGEYVYEEELTEEFFNNLEDIDQ